MDHRNPILDPGVGVTPCHPGVGPAMSSALNCILDDESGQITGIQDLGDVTDILNDLNTNPRLLNELHGSNHRMAEHFNFNPQLDSNDNLMLSSLKGDNTGYQSSGLSDQGEPSPLPFYPEEQVVTIEPYSFSSHSRHIPSSHIPQCTDFPHYNPTMNHPTEAALRASPHMDSALPGLPGGYSPAHTEINDEDDDDKSIFQQRKRRAKRSSPLRQRRIGSSRGRILSEDERREKRKRQNREAAGRCRIKKREQFEREKQDYERLKASHAQMSKNLQETQRRYDSLLSAIREHQRHCNFNLPLKLEP